MFVNCVTYRDGIKLKDIEPSDIDVALRESGTFVWVALKDPDAAEMEMMKREFQLHPLAVEDASHGFQRPKIDEYQNMLFASVRSPEFVNNEIQFRDYHVFVGENFVLSIRRNCERGFASIRTRCENEPHLLKKGSGFVFYALIDTLVDWFFPVVERLEDEFDVLEADMFSNHSYGAQAQSLYRLKQKVMQVKHVADPLLEAVAKMSGGRVPKVVSETQDYFRDVYDHLQRIEQSLDNIREALVTAIQVNLTLVALKESEVNKQLAAWAALIGVPTLIAGIYGMNFKHMPELEFVWGYPVSVACMIVIDAILFYRFKKIGWI